MKQHQPNQHRSSWSTSQRNLLAGAFISLLFCADGFAPAAIINKGVSVRIMPVGDSITEGKYTQGGYRNPLLADRMMANRKMSASSCVC